ncbi:MAG: CocE/NonD family hydrolase, partial [Flavobacteriales bacterium]
NKWREFQNWPPKKAKKKKLYFRGDKNLNFTPPKENEKKKTEWISDPDNPVPYTEDIKIVFTPKKYMTDDQRFAGRRSDVMAFTSEVLEEDVTISGDMLANLKVSTSGTASDWVVKLIDVYPSDTQNNKHTPKGVKLQDYEQMVRSEVIRGRFRNSYENPEPFEPGKVTKVELPLQDIMHTFKKGHQIMIQVQSTWFPLVDINPHTYVD